MRQNIYFFVGTFKVCGSIFDGSAGTFNGVALAITFLSMDVYYHSHYSEEEERENNQ